VLYKPAGCVTTLSDPENRPTIKAYLEEIPERVYPVGRLDYDVEGALIVTNDGDLAFSMMHPRFGVRRTYLAKVHGVPAAEQLERLRRGVRLEDGRARALEADLHSRTPKNTWVRVVVAEGRQHLVKRLMEAVGAPVQKLHRADYGGIGVGGMRPGEVLEQLVALEPKDMAQRLRLGETYRRMDQPQLAIQAYQHAAKFFGDEGQLIKAIGAVKIILEIDPRNAEAQRQLAAMNERRIGKVSLGRTGLKKAPPPAPRP